MFMRCRRWKLTLHRGRSAYLWGRCLVGDFSAGEGGLTVYELSDIGGIVREGGQEQVGL
jgi:hypothetical protein